MGGGGWGGGGGRGGHQTFDFEVRGDGRLYVNGQDWGGGGGRHIVNVDGGGGLWIDHRRVNGGNGGRRRNRGRGGRERGDGGAGGSGVAGGPPVVTVVSLYDTDHRI